MDIETLKNKINDLEKSKKLIDEEMSKCFKKPIPNYIEIQTLKTKKKNMEKQIKYIQEKLIPDILA